MSKFAKAVLSEARYIYRNTGVRKGWSIRDCVELAADGVRQIEDERRQDSRSMAARIAEMNWMAQ